MANDYTSALSELDAIPDAQPTGNVQAMPKIDYAGALSELDGIPDNQPLSIPGQIGLAGKAISRGLNQAVTDVLPQAIGGVIRGKNVPLRDASPIDSWIAGQDADMAGKSMTPAEQETKVFGVKAGTIEGGLKNLGYSGAVMVPQALAYLAGRSVGTSAGALAGPAAPVVAPITGAIGGQAAGMLTGFQAAKRADINQVLRQKRDQMLAVNPNMTEAEWEGVKRQVDAAAEAHGSAEGKWEAVGNALQLALMALGAKWGVKIPLPSGVAKTLGAVAGTAVDVPLEVGTEALTQQDQAAAERSMGLREAGPPLTFKQAVGEVAPQTLVTTLGTMGLGSTVAAINQRRAGQAATPGPEVDDTETLLAELAQRQAEQDAATAPPSETGGKTATVFYASDSGVGEAINIDGWTVVGLEENALTYPNGQTRDRAKLKSPDGKRIAWTDDRDLVEQAADIAFNAEQEAKNKSAAPQVGTMTAPSGNQVELPPAQPAPAWATEPNAGRPVPHVEPKPVVKDSLTVAEPPSSGPTPPAIMGDVPAQGIAPASIAPETAQTPLGAAEPPAPMPTHTPVPEGVAGANTEPVGESVAERADGLYAELDKAVERKDDVAIHVIKQAIAGLPAAEVEAALERRHPAVSVAPSAPPAKSVKVVSAASLARALTANPDMDLTGAKDSWLKVAATKVKGELRDKVQAEVNRRAQVGRTASTPGSYPGEAGSTPAPATSRPRAVTLDAAADAKAIMQAVSARMSAARGKPVTVRTKRVVKGDDSWIEYRIGEYVFRQDGLTLRLPDDVDAEQWNMAVGPDSQYRIKDASATTPSQSPTPAVGKTAPQQGLTGAQAAQEQGVGAPKPGKYAGKVGYRLTPRQLKSASFGELKDAAKANTYADGTTVWNQAKFKSAASLRAELLRHRAMYMEAEGKTEKAKMTPDQRSKLRQSMRGRQMQAGLNRDTEYYAAKEMSDAKTGPDKLIFEDELYEGDFVRVGKEWFKVTLPADGRGKTLVDGIKIELDASDAIDAKVVVSPNSPNYPVVEKEHKEQVKQERAEEGVVESDPFSTGQPADQPESRFIPPAKKPSQDEMFGGTDLGFELRGDTQAAGTTFTEQQDAAKAKAEQDAKQKPLLAVGETSSPGVTRATYDTAVQDESRAVPMGERAEAFDSIDAAPADVRNAVSGGTGTTLGIDAQGRVRAVTIGDRSYFFLDRYADESELRQDIREEFFHRIENEYASYSKTAQLGLMVYRGKWSKIRSEIERNYGFKPGQDGFFRELTAKAYRDGLTDRTVWGRFVDYIVTATRNLARKLGAKVSMNDAEMRDYVNTVLKAKAQGRVAATPRFAIGDAKEPAITSIKKEITDAEYAAKGYPEPEPLVQESVAEITAAAKGHVDADKTLTDKTVQGFIDTPHAPRDTVELGILLIAKQEREADLNKAMKSLADAEKTGNAAAIKQAQIDYTWADRRDREMAQLLATGEQSPRTLLGRGLNYLKTQIKEDFSVVRLIRSIEQAQDWKPVSNEQRVGAIRIAEDMAKARTQYDEATRQKNETVMAAQADKIRSLEEEIQRVRDNDAATREETQNQADIRWANEVQEYQKLIAGKKARPRSKQVADEGAAEFAEAMVEIRAKLNVQKMAVSATDPALFDLLVKAGRGLIKQSGDNALFKNWNLKMRELVGSKLTATDIREIYDESVKQANVRIAADESTAILEGAKRNKGIPDTETHDPEANIRDTVKRLMNKQVENGVTVVEEAAQNVSEIIQDAFPGTTADDVYRLYSDYGKVRLPSDDADAVTRSQFRSQSRLKTHLYNLLHQLELQRTGDQRQKPNARTRELEREVRATMKRLGYNPKSRDTLIASAMQARKTALQNQIEDIDRAIANRERMITNKEILPDDAETAALRKKRDERKELYNQMFPKQPLTPEQQLNIALKYEARSLADWQQRYKDAQQGKFGKPKKDAVELPPSAQLDAIRADRDMIKAQVKELYDLANPKLTPEELAIKTKIARMEAAERGFRRRIAEGDFETRQARFVDISNNPAALAAQERMADAKADFDLLKEQARRSKLTTFEKVKEGFGSVYDLSRDMLSSMDVSAPGRQGFYAMFLNPRLWAKANGSMFRALSRKQSVLEAQRLKERRNYRNGAYKTSGLKIAEADGKGNYGKIDNRYQLALVNRFPPLAASNRAYATFLNRIRADLFDYFLAQTHDPTDVNPDKIKAIAQDVNMITGAGQLQRAQGLSLVLYAPSFIKAQWDLLTLAPVWRGKSPAEVRILMAKQYGKVMASMMAMYAVASMFRGDDEDDKIEYDPTSSSFGSINVGHYKVGLFGYARPLLTLMARYMNGTMKTDKGVINLKEGFHPPWVDEKAAAQKVPYGNGIWPITGRFVKSKLHPGMSALYAFLSEQDFSGNRQTPTQTIMAMFRPIAPGQISEIAQTEETDTLVILSMLTLLGFDVTPDYSDPVIKKYLDKKRNK